MLISPEVGQDFLILIESKFDAVLGAPQLEKYRAWLRAKKVEGYVNCVLVTITVLEVSATADVDIRIRWADVQRMLENCPIADRAVSMIAKSFAKFLKERGISPMHIARVAYDLLGSARSYLELVNQIEDILNHFRNQGSPGYLLPKLTKIQTNEDTAAWRGIYSQSRTYYVGFGISLIGDPAMFLWAEFTVEGNRANLVEQFPEELKRYHCQGREWIRKIELAEGRTSEPPSFDGKNTFFVFLADTSGKLNGNAQLMLDWFNSVSQQMFQLLGTSFKP